MKNGIVNGAFVHCAPCTVQTLSADWSFASKWNGEHKNRKINHGCFHATDNVLSALPATHFGEQHRRLALSAKREFAVILRYLRSLWRSFNKIYKHNPAWLGCSGSDGVLFTDQQTMMMYVYVCVCLAYFFVRKRKNFSAGSDSSTKLPYKWHWLNAFAKVTASKEFPVIISCSRLFCAFFSSLLSFAGKNNKKKIIGRTQYSRRIYCICVRRRQACIKRWLHQTSIVRHATFL